MWEGWEPVFSKVSLRKYLTLDKILFGLFVILLTTLIRYGGFGHWVLTFFLNEIPEYYDWLFSGTLCLFLKLPLKGVIEEISAYFKNSLAIHCMDYTPTDSPDFLPNARRLTHITLIDQGRPCDTLATDTEGNYVIIPRLHKSEFNTDPFLANQEILKKMTPDQLAYYNKLNTIIKDFELKRDGIMAKREILPGDPIYGHVRNADGSIWTIEPYYIKKPLPWTHQELERHNFCKLERHAFLKRTANAFKQNNDQANSS